MTWVSPDCYALFPPRDASESSRNSQKNDAQGGVGITVCKLLLPKEPSKTVIWQKSCFGGQFRTSFVFAFYPRWDLMQAHIHPEFLDGNTISIVSI